jgi:hypothetical protein
MSGKKIVWLASYPKSGNTWFRVFLTNLLQDAEEPASINKLTGGPIASSRQLFDEATGLASSDLTEEEIMHLRPEVFRNINKKANTITFHKIHEAFITLNNGQYLVPPDVTRGAIYFIRNPLDIAVSLAHHNNTSIDKAIEQINNNDHAFCSNNKRLHVQLKQPLYNWSNHVISWIENQVVQVEVVKYEEMHGKTFEVFKRAIEFAGLNYTDEKVKKAINNSRFEELKKQEERGGFKEKSPGAATFFREGKSGSWKIILKRDQIKKILDVHGEAMKRFHYIDDNGQIIDP